MKMLFLPVIYPFPFVHSKKLLNFAACMRVLIVNTSERNGGAAVAAYRLMQALCNNGVKAKMLVRDRQSDDPRVVALGSPWLQRWRFLWERLTVLFRLHGNRRHLFAIDTGSMGCDITRTEEFREADVIHLHWVNQGMLSLADIRKILRSGKPVVWTMHDIWPATAICHLTLGCHQYLKGCGRCRYLPGGGSEHDLSSAVFQRKARMLQSGAMTFVACSRWLEGEARNSALLRGHKVTSIPNTLDTRVFCPGDRAEARQAEQLPADKRLLLFVCQRANNPYKGMQYLVEACRLLADEHAELREQIGVVVIGGHADEVVAELPFESFALGYVADEQRMARIYRAADVFVLPSLSENLPNTIMESMACGVPCVGFKVGGIPEEIDHKKNGYVAAYRDSRDLARGLYWSLFEADATELSHAAVRKVSQHYSQSSVSLRYSELYQVLIAQKHFKL